MAMLNPPCRSEKHHSPHVISKSHPFADLCSNHRGMFYFSTHSLLHRFDHCLDFAFLNQHLHTGQKYTCKALRTKRGVIYYKSISYLLWITRVIRLKLSIIPSIVHVIDIAYHVGRAREQVYIRDGVLAIVIEACAIVVGWCACQLWALDRHCLVGEQWNCYSYDCKLHHY